MPQFRSALNKNAESYSTNRRDMLSLIDTLDEIRARAEQLSEKRRPRFEQRGQLTPRERLQNLLDSDLPYLELYGLANFLVDTDNRETSVAGASLLAGIGFVSGIRAVILVDDSGIAAGAATPTTGEKVSACLDVALRHKLPFVHLVESAGADLFAYRVEAWAHAGGMYYRHAKLSAAGIPTITVLHGPATAGGAYMPGMSDYVIGVQGRGRASLGGAALVRAATGEISDEEELAGTDMHATISGLVEYTAPDDAQALQMARQLVARLNWGDRSTFSSSSSNTHTPKYKPPAYDTDEIAGLVPVDYRKPYDIREVVARVVDDSDFRDFKPRYGAGSVCIQAAVEGNACAFIGNNGPIDPAGATKAAQFMQLCDQANLPVIFFSNTTGYMVGREYEHAGMIKHGSKMIQAVSNIRVPRITLYIGASFGAGNYGMCGIGFDPDFIFAWPNATTGVMGGSQAAGTMEQVARSGAERRGTEVDEEALAQQNAKLINYFDAQSDAFYTSGRLLDQGVIDPRDTRKVLAFALETCREAQQRELRANTFGIARF